MKIRLYTLPALVFCMIFVSIPALLAQHEAAPLLRPEFLWLGTWESAHNLASRFEFTLTAARANLAFRLVAPDRRPASSAEVFRESFGGETSGSAISALGLGLYHLNSGSRLLYGTIDNYGLAARIRNVWIRGAPYTQSREDSGADLKTAVSSTAKAEGYALLETNGIRAGPGVLRGFAAVSAFNDDENRKPSLNAGLGYEAGSRRFAIEGYYTGRTLSERNSSTWFNEKPALPVRDTRLFAGSALLYFPAFALSGDLAYSQTFAFGSDYYGSAALRLGNKPWRFSLAFDAAGSRYVDSAGSNPGSGFRSAAKLERWGKKTGLFRLNTVWRGPGPEQGLAAALADWDFPAMIQSFNRMSGEIYYRFPANKNSFGLTRFSFSADRDGRDQKKVLDTGAAMAAFKLGPVNYTGKGKIIWINHNKSTGADQNGLQLNSFQISQSISWTIRSSFLSGTDERKKTGSGKKSSFTVLFSAQADYEKAVNKEGIWNTSFSASLRTRKNRITVKAAAADFPKKWEFTLSWRLLF